MIKCSKALGEIIDRKKRYFTPDEMETTYRGRIRLIPPSFKFLEKN